MYFGGIAFALLGLSVILSDSNKIYSYVLLIISFIYSGSSSENFSAILLLLLFLLIVYRVMKYQIKVNKKALFDKEIIAFFTCFLAFLTMFFAPGNKIRQSFYPTPSITNTIVISIKSLEFLLFKLIYNKLLIIFILSFPFIYLGALCRGNHPNNGLKLSKWLALGSILFVCFLWITLLPNSYAISWGVEPLRSLTHVSLYIICFLCFFYFFVGYQTLFNRKLALILSIVSCVTLIIYSFIGFIFNIPETIKYVRSQDEMIEQILKFKKYENKDTLLLDNIYSSEDVVFIMNDISLDHINKCISDGLNLEYAVELKKNIPNRGRNP